MTDDKLSFLETPPADQTTVTEPPVQAEPAPVVEAPVVEKPSVPVAEAQPKGDGHSVPLPKYLDTYNENRTLKQQIADLKRAQETKAETPDPLTDPEGFATHQQAAFDQKILRERVNMSGLMAEQVYGKEVVDAAFEALKEKQDEFTYQRIMSSPHPYDALVKWHKREQVLSEVGEDAAAYKARIIAEFQAQQQAPAAGLAPAAPPQQQKPVIPPSSLTRAPAGPKPSEVPVGAGQAFDGVFAR